jgi:hypothetical protein
MVVSRAGIGNSVGSTGPMGVTEPWLPGKARKLSWSGLSKLLKRLSTSSAHSTRPGVNYRCSALLLNSSENVDTNLFNSASKSDSGP